ncbi:hybrid sensor histidine kinase/response regulator [Pseudodesulfovibrio senegalensis]|jgi:signal transduction histidine kinase|nr:hybrid sensor histidine kinase/response regulator [Pseudodesulfovibrio senegalensis]
MPDDMARDQPLVLVVEDSRMVLQEISRRLLDTREFRVVTATTLAEAEQVMAEAGQDIFFSILDVTLPDAPDGEVVDHACARGIPSIVFTANLDEELRTEILSKNIIDYVVKDRTAVRQLVEQALRLKRNRGVRTMVVDDSPSFRSFIRQLLERQMFEVVEASSGKEGMDVLAAHDDMQLAIVDYEMPGMSGLELVRQLRAQRGRDRLAVIGVSARVTEPLSAWFIKSGANDFLHKPFTEEEFNCRVLQNMDMLHMVRELKRHDEEKNRFLGVVAHDLRTPINGMSGFLDMLLEGQSDPLSEDQREILEIVQTSTDNMLHMVNDLLDVSVIHSGRLDLRIAATDFAALVAERVRIQNFAASQKSISIEMESDALPPLNIDARRMAQMVDNLLSNAIKYSPHGSTTRVWVRREDDVVHFVVVDEGPGISVEDQTRLFQSFARTGNQPTGDELSVGLGLMIVRSIVQAHGGDVWVESDVGNGAEFHVTLPLAADTGG